MPTRSPAFRTAAALVAAALAPAALGQITLISASRSVTATAGDGSGSSAFSSPALADFNHSVSKSFPGGHAAASQFSTTTPWRLLNLMTAESAAPSPGQAGSGAATYSVVFSSATNFDLETLVGTSAGPNGQGSYNFAMYNDVTAQLIYQGDGVRYDHLPAGRYRVVQTLTATWGGWSTTMDLTFHPGNDSCSNAWGLQNGVITGDTSAATSDGECSCGDADTTRSVWFRYTSPGTGPLTVTTCGSGFDTVLAAYNPGACPLDTSDQIVCSDDIPAGSGTPCDNTHQSSTTVDVVAGQQVFFRLSGYSGSNGAYVLNVGPLNDFAWGAIPVADGGSYSFDNRLALTDGPVLNSCTNNGNDTQVNGDLWYAYTPAGPGMLSLDTCGAGFDTKIALYSGHQWFEPMSYVACNDDACGLASSLQNIPVVAGSTYYVRVGGYRATRGVGTLHVAFTPACPADFNGDGFLDFFDYDDYVSCFENGTCPPGKTADFNQDGFADFFDYDDFVTAFDTGC